MILTKKAIQQYFPDIITSQANAALKNLKGTRKLLSKPERWGKEGFEILKEEDDYGEVFELEQPKYCLIGAIDKIDGPGEVLAARILMYALSNPVLLDDESDEFDVLEDTETVTAFNDNGATKHKDVLKLLDKSIKFTETLIAVAPKKLPKVSPNV